MLVCHLWLQGSKFRGLTVKGPPDSNIAPPGYYMLFLVNKLARHHSRPGSRFQVQLRRSPKWNCIPSEYPHLGTWSRENT